MCITRDMISDTQYMKYFLVCCLGTNYLIILPQKSNYDKCAQSTSVFCVSSFNSS